MAAYQLTEVTPDHEQIVSLYASVGWTNYSGDRDHLIASIEGSQYVVYAVDDGGSLYGLARAITDSASVLFLQDILVDPVHQRAGIGRALFERVLERFRHVRRKVLLTGEEPAQIAFYESLGFTNLNATPLNGFIRIEGYSFDA